MAATTLMGSQRVDSSVRMALVLSRLGMSLWRPSRRLVTAMVLIPATMVPRSMPSSRPNASGMAKCTA